MLLYCQRDKCNASETQTKIFIFSYVNVTHMPTAEKPLNHYVTVALAHEQFEFLSKKVDAGQAVSLSDAARSIISKAMEEGAVA